jgi:ferritin
MLSEKMVAQLNDQINLEFYSSNLYLQMSAWCEFKGYEGASAFLKIHAEEEMQHMQRLFTYVNETGNLAKLGTIEAPPTEFKSLTAVFEETHKHECLITKAINELAHTAFSEHDYSTFNFLQWYVAEQHEEEKLFQSILDKIAIIGEDGRGLYFIDKELAKMAENGPEASIVEDAGA